MRTHIYLDEEEDTVTELPGDTRRPPARETSVAPDMTIASEDTETGEKWEPRIRYTPAAAMTMQTTELIRTMNLQHQETMANMTKMIMELARSQQTTQQQLMATQKQSKSS